MIKQTFAFISIAFLTALSNRSEAQQFVKGDPGYILDFPSTGTHYYSSAFAGNGRTGCMIWKGSDSSLHIAVGRADITDTRSLPEEDSLPGRSLYLRPRLNIGAFEWRFNGTITAASQQMLLNKGLITGNITTSAGAVSYQVWIPAGSNTIVLEYEASGQEQGSSWIFRPDTAISPRLRMGGAYKNSAPASVLENPNPDPLTGTLGKVSFCSQSLTAGGGYTTAWTVKTSGEKKGICFIHIGYERTGNVAAVQSRSLAAVQAVIKRPLVPLFQQHLAWWKDFYTKGDISLPDKELELFFRTQLYKLAAATRKDGAIIDLMGPWMNPITPWPAIWWNLNTQLTYSPLMTAHHAELAEPMFRALWEKREQLHRNVPPSLREGGALAINRTSSDNLVAPIRPSDAATNQFEVGNLVWQLYYFYEYYQKTGDRQTLEEKIQPLLKGAVRFLLNLLYKGEDGRLHLPVTASPEYKPAADANYSLSALYWGCKTLLATDSILGKKDASHEIWEQTLRDITPFPTGESGYLIGRDVPLSAGHRHYSHLLQVYPYQVTDVRAPGERELLERSLQHWLSFKSGLQGYTFTGAAAMYAMLGKGEEAYAMLQQLLDRYIQPNTLYRESGPVIETPLSAVNSIQYMLLHSYRDTILLFPALPSAWKTAGLQKWLANGAFELSATAENGILHKAVIKSLAGNDCHMELKGWNGSVTDEAGKKITITIRKNTNGTQTLSWATIKGKTYNLSNTPY